MKVNKGSLWTLAWMLATSPLFFFFVDRGEAARGRAAWIGGGILFAAAMLRWRLRTRPWFWITVGLLLVLHILLIVFVPWTDRPVPAIALLPIGLLDLGIMLGCIGLVEKLFERYSRSDP